MTDSEIGKINWDAVRKRITDSEKALSESSVLSEQEIAALYDKRAQQLAGRRQDNTIAATFSVLVFKMGQESYAIDLADLSEIVSYRNCTPVPDELPALLGLINVRGEIWPVLDLARLMELEHQPAETGFVLIVRSPHTAISFKVDQIESLRDLRREQATFFKENTVELKQSYLKGVTQDTLMLIDIGSLIGKFVPIEK